ncbi:MULTISPECIES: tetratricopeptide repeat protein [Filomicrobium]|uniref:Uncharacterized protein n=1 Tax=Filomicrobium insigne TaxID=418854 RepID=A0A1H0LR85_9HYPH|nr:MULTISPECIES: tetratricopeptide repeat protein [Filomicrobium]MCV0368706.1 sel1 repeat family protein [Filomicrobium sp.]SDO70551.1 hypothetical protein SAMN04488061_1437 [Filomicrobium insigne]
MSPRSIGILFLGVVAQINAAHAETSSWSFRPPGTETKPSVAKTEAKPKSKTTSTHFKKQVPGPEIKDSAGPKLNATGEDAYIAFDQGKYLTALKLAEAAAAKGEAAAHTLIGRIYSEGHGVRPDNEVAARWYTRGAELGDVNSMFAIAIMLAEGRGVEKDLAAAATMFEKAAQTGHPEANYNLGLLFLNGTGKPENPLRAAKHIAYAAEQGVAAAQYDLSALYQSGTGVEPDAYQAATWISRAAAQGMAAAQYDYAVMLLSGKGINKDEPKAIELLTAAAEKGIPGAQNRLAYVYGQGVKVNKSQIEMAKWRYIAKASGFEDKKLDEVVGKLPADIRTKAEQAAVSWREQVEVAMPSQ